MGLNREIWAQHAVTKLYADNSFLQYSRDRSDWVENGEILHIPNSAGPYKVVENRSTSGGTVTAITDQQVLLQLARFNMHEPILIPWAEKFELSYSKRDLVIGEAFSSVTERVASRILHEWCVGLTAEEVSSVGNEVLSALKALALIDQYFTDNNFPENGRHAVLPASFLTQIKIDKDAYLAMITSGMTVIDGVMRYNNVRVHTRSWSPYFDTTAGTPTTRPLQVFYDPAPPLKVNQFPYAATDRRAIVGWHETAVNRALGSITTFDNPERVEYDGGDLIQLGVRALGIRGRFDDKGIVAYLPV